MSNQCVPSIANFYADPTSPYSAFQQEHRSGGSMPVRMFRAEQQAHELVDPAVPEVVLCLSLRSDMPFQWDIGDSWAKEQQMRSGDFDLVPPNTEARFRCRGDHEILMAAIPAGPLADLLDTHRKGPLSRLDTLTGRMLFRDEQLRRILMQMWTESARTGGASDLVFDGLTQVLIGRLLDKAGQQHQPQRVFALDQAAMTRIECFVEEQLAERITVETLASVLDMPRWTFADAFKATTGETPHAYVTTKRVERACDLLRLGDMPLAEIAYATGFASQSHMTDTFRRVLGTTPGKWRAESRN
ncbi:helix-turn-helix domain-containing protein [Roseobacter denitrificans]|uniref:AraC family transcriptional regulatory protein, putative n=1 Tax=Roseobacter denitrificans (strain ATCC 33942 / OCh 114) TaxID=375451 RepID=Q07GK1_ROSDO|nr:AraC family transcriptional regulator [Roseobacter denitrificans]ABI93398.1 AraC family transcriptional regulatory protein, putative [Roseobacter denitrificans OCh 114]SFG47781.1 transcriptional regulator, AraC family [Roseobacter denitrificans OCh 114]